MSLSRDLAIELRTNKVDVTSFYDANSGRHGFVYSTGYNGSSKEVARSKPEFLTSESAAEEGGIILRRIRESDLSKIWNR